MVKFMDALLDELERLMIELHDALVHMDAPRVLRLSNLQSICLNQLEQQCLAHPEVVDGFRERLMRIQGLSQRNRLLLENAMNLTDHSIQSAIASNCFTYNGWA